MSSQVFRYTDGVASSLAMACILGAFTLDLSCEILARNCETSPISNG